MPVGRWQRIDFPIYQEEVERAVETCYPAERGTSLIGCGSLLFEIGQNPERYPLFTKVKLERSRKTILTRICTDFFKWELYTSGAGSRRNCAVYKRPEQRVVVPEGVRV